MTTGNEASAGDEEVNDTIGYRFETVRTNSFEMSNTRPKNIAAIGTAELCSRGKMC